MHQSTSKPLQNQNLTERQHFVPRTYLRAWTPAQWNDHVPRDQTKLWVHDLKSQKIFSTGVNGICAENWLYEQDITNPDNKIERWFTAFEGNYRGSIEFLEFVLQNALDQKISEENNEFVKRTLVSCLSSLPNHLQIIKSFAAVSYARVPEGLALMQADLASGSETLAHDVKVDTMFQMMSFAIDSTLLDRFKSLSLQVLVNIGGNFVTSDRPCYDLDTSAVGIRPLFGFDIGRHQFVIIIFPISPRIAVLLHPPNHPSFSMDTCIRILDDEEVNIVNVATIAFANRWIIAKDKNGTILEQRSTAKDNSGCT